MAPLRPLTVGAMPCGCGYTIVIISRPALSVVMTAPSEVVAVVKLTGPKLTLMDREGAGRVVVR